MSDMKYPKSDFLNRGHKKRESKAECAVKSYNALLEDKTHRDNQTEAYEKNVRHILNSLLEGADELENKYPGEGIYTLIMLALRNNIRLKDKIVDLEYRIKKISNREKNK